MIRSNLKRYAERFRLRLRRSGNGTRLMLLIQIVVIVIIATRTLLQMYNTSNCNHNQATGYPTPLCHCLTLCTRKRVMMYWMCSRRTYSTATNKRNVIWLNRNYKMTCRMLMLSKKMLSKRANNIFSSRNLMTKTCKFCLTCTNHLVFKLDVEY